MAQYFIGIDSGTSGIKAVLFEQFPHLKDDVYANVRLTYQFIGSFYAFYRYENTFGYDNVRQAVDRITRLFEKDGRDKEGSDSSSNPDEV